MALIGVNTGNWSLESAAEKYTKQTMLSKDHDYTNYNTNPFLINQQYADDIGWITNLIETSRLLRREVPPKFKLKNLLVNDTKTEEHEVEKNGDTTWMLWQHVGSILDILYVWWTSLTSWKTICWKIADWHHLWKSAGNHNSWSISISPTSKHMQSRPDIICQYYFFYLASSSLLGIYWNRLGEFVIL